MLMSGSGITIRIIEDLPFISSIDSSGMMQPKTSPNLTDWDAVSIYLNLDGNIGHAPGPNSYLFELQLVIIFKHLTAVMAQPGSLRKFQ